MAEQCKEFNSLKYRTLISTGTNIESTVDTSEEAINNFLNMDIENNKKGIWSKLTKTEKTKKIKNYVNNILKPEYNLTDEEMATATRFFTITMERKKLSKNNELTYNQDDGLIEQIGGLNFNTDTRRFTINAELSNRKKTKKIIQPI
jgi:acetylglutamate synthase